MPNMTHGHLGFLGVGLQTGTDLKAAKVASAYWTAYHELDFQERRGEQFDPTSRRSAPEGASLGNYDVQVRGVLEASTEGALVPLLHSVLGGAHSTATVGTTGKRHTLPAAEYVPTSGRLTMERRLGTLAKSQRCNAIVKRVTFDATQPAYARIPFEAVGSKAEILDPASTATLPAANTVLSQKATTFTLDSLTTWQVRNFRWDVARVLDEDDYVVTDQHRRDAEYGDLVATIDAEAVLPDLDVYERFFGANGATAPTDTEAFYDCSIETKRNDVIAGGTANHGIKFNAPKLFLTAGPPLQARGREPVLTRIQGQAVYDTVSSKAVDVEVTNSVSSYTLP